jgi:hypothetical protein
MCKFRFRFLVALLTFGVGVLVIGIWRALPVSENSDEANHSQPISYYVEEAQQTEEYDPFKPDKIASLNCRDQQNTINYQGISFACNSSFSSEIEVSEFPKSPLLSDQDKPDYVHPSFITFKLTNKEGKPEDETSYDNRISVYPIEEYKQMYLIDRTYSQGFDEDIKSFRNILSTKQAHKWSYARILRATDGHFEFKSHLKYISFKNGKGVGFVTQIQIETTIINNEELVWIFEGITDDGKYYLRGTFPIKASVLPDKDTDEFEGYSLNNYKKLSEKHGKYVTLVKKRLDNFPANKFQPNLEGIVNLILSLEVK